jgi:hypothetical protein
VLGWKQPAGLVDGCSFFAGSSSFSPDQPKKSQPNSVIVYLQNMNIY